MRKVSGPFRLMIVAGEASGDAHAAALVNALRRAKPDVDFEFFGATGPLMRSAGVYPVVHSDDLSILGLLEIGRALPEFLRAYKKLKEAVRENRPDAVILVDWPDFNLKLARALHRRGLKVIYYISPQLWAWRSYRLHNIRRDVDLLLSILPFEKQWYAERGIKNVEFVGHPLAGEVKTRSSRADFCRSHNLNPDSPVVSFLPGSRAKELQRILPSMLEAADVMSQHDPEIQFVLVVAPSRSLEEARNILARHSSSSLKTKICLVHHETREALAASDAAAIASGTATLEAALLGTPLVIVYKESAINWHTLGRLITTDHYGLVNLVAGERLVTELMQDELNGNRLAKELLALLDKKRNETMRERLHDVARQLGEGGTSDRAAEHILAALR